MNIQLVVEVAILQFIMFTRGVVLLMVHVTQIVQRMNMSMEVLVILKLDLAHGGKNIATNAEDIVVLDVDVVLPLEVTPITMVVQMMKQCII